MGYHTAKVYLPLTRYMAFFLFVTLFTAISILYFIYEFNFLPDGSLFEKFIISFTVFDYFTCELLILLFVGQILIYRNVFFRIVLYVLSSLYIAIYFIQILSVNNGKEFLSRLAIENIDHLYLFLNYKNILYICLIIFTCSSLVIIIEKTKDPPSRRRKTQITASLLILVLIAITCSGKYWLPDQTVKVRNAYLSNNDLSHTSPIYSFISVLLLQKIKYNSPLLHTDLKAYELNEINRFGFHYDPTKEYPLIKETIYSENFPFPQKAKNQKIKPNVIVIFSEGLSARAVGVYHSRYPDLTPHIDDLAQSSMIVRRYFSHTAATYRGLHGQLCSLFPTLGGLGGWDSGSTEISHTMYLSLANLFNRQGYETIFLDSHHKNHSSRVDEMLSLIGFDTVVLGDVLADKYLNKAPPSGNMTYSDHQYFESTIGFLKERLESGKVEEPFFMSLYNFGTHSFLKNSKDGIRYRSGKNSSLNNIHNFDHAFGKFWNYLKSSPYAKNTIIILTADHSHYHDKSFIAAFDEPGYQKVFVDQIPLIIHDPLRNLPDDYDAEISSSIDFAPTIAHYLGLDNTRNPFMGTSIFERSPAHRNAAIAALGPGEIFLINEERIHKMADAKKHRATLEILDTYISIARMLEKKDKIWDGKYNCGSMGNCEGE